MPVQTTTSGSLPRTQALLDANRARTFEDDGFTLRLTPEVDALTAQAVADVVERQRAAGITLVGDGEFGKAMTGAVDYGAWWGYSFQRVGGLSLTEVNAFNEPPVESSPGDVRLTSFLNRRDRQRFPAVYAEAVETGAGATAFPSTTGPLVYRGQGAVASDIRNLTAALRPGERGFLTAIAPGSAARVRNEYYASDEEHIFAWADALREEYRAIVEAGLIHVPEGRRLFSLMSVADNLVVGGHNKRAYPHVDQNLTKVYQMFPRLLERAAQLAMTLSGGEQQMVAIGRGLMAMPKLLMLDEPSLGLAPLLIQEIFRTVRMIADQGTTVLLVEQDVRHSLSLSDRGYVLEHGRVAMEGDAKELMDNPHIKTAYLGI